ncbi:probable inactive receptor kinase At4g23740 [Rhododendron vialii]|uniref:probable inactive receptor kinase At4g23740 n=1 Tax=Rhododendron vialii TaxID=182163 RepID=UPI00265E3424|nr:probable inactive receptor kinase At4g23740 [Rhododendron vialii]
MKSLSLLLLLLSLLPSLSFPSLLLQDKLALLDFSNSLPHSRYLNWTDSSPVCTHWTGITCNPDRSRVISLRLPGVGFHGPVPPNTLGRLSALQILSLRSNAITGPFPSDLFNLSKLSFLYLQFNRFAGPLPADFSKWKNLTIVNLSYNGFNGSIPVSLSNLTQLQALNLANNSVSGEIPDLYLPSLQQVNLSCNRLTGIVPKWLQKFPSSVFSGNDVVLGNYSTSVPTDESNYYPRSENVGKLSEMAVLGIVVGCCVLGLIGFASILVVCCLRKRGEEDVLFSGKLEKGKMSPEKVISRSQDANNRLFFFEGCSYVFDLEDLLRASAEVLGKGTFGTAFKAVLEDANTVVVKRLKEVSAGKRDFEQQMEAVGSIKHANVSELRAYYYSKDEKLLVYDYFSRGSVAAMLHGKRGEERIPLDWDTRLRISIGAARGIARIHAENNGKLVHGNVKSSNIFLNSQNYGCVSDHGLSAIMSPLGPPIARAAGYRAPEVTDTRKSSQSSDVYSFGVLLLELLTAKSPVYSNGGDEVIHLVRWVHSVVREEWTAEVFDVELLRYPNIEEEMVEMLQIALACVVRMPEQRPKMPDVVKMIENVRMTDYEKQQSSGAKSDNSTTPQDASGLESSTPL